MVLEAFSRPPLRVLVSRRSFLRLFEIGLLEGAVVAEANHEARADADLVSAASEVGDCGCADYCCVVAQ
jgi:hypothetical protein